MAQEGDRSGNSRRRFLRRTLLGGALLTLGGIVGRHLSGYHLPPEIAARLRVLSPKEYVILAAACRRLLAPDEAGAPDIEAIEVVNLIDDYLARVDPAICDDVKALLHVLEHGTALATLSRFTHLDAADQDAVLDAWQTSRIDLRRRGFAALKSLAMLGYYDDPRTFAILGYGGPLVGKT